MRPAEFPELPSRHCAAWTLVLMLAACSPAPDSSSSPAIDAAPTANAMSAQAGVAQQGRVRGIYEAREGGLFTACGETSRRHVLAMDAVAQDVLSAAKVAETDPHFILASGDLVGRDGVVIRAIDLVTGDAFGCESRLDATILGARGTETLWTLEVTAAAQNFSAGPDAKSQIFPYRSLQASAGTMLLESANADRGIRIELQARPCIEKMTGTTFGLAANIRIDGQSLAGCAWRGLANP